MIEQSVIVNEHDEIIGHKDRSKLGEGDWIRVTGIWLENRSGEVLIAQRSPTKKIHPGLWGPAAGGSVEKDETCEQNAYKELEEELGVTGVKLARHDIITIRSQTDIEGLHCYWYTGIADIALRDLSIEVSEVSQAKWVGKAWLLHDVVNRPDDYVPSSQTWPELFY